jgi:hypothetical protein
MTRTDEEEKRGKKRNQMEILSVEAIEHRISELSPMFDLGDGPLLV